MSITEEDLARLEALAQAATQGPLTVEWRRACEHYILGPFGAVFAVAETGCDAAFIAAARNAVPALVAEVRRLRRLHAAMNRTVSEAIKDAESALADRDALRAENERLRADIHRHLTSQAYLDIKSENERLREGGERLARRVVEYDVIIERRGEERDAALAEAAELRASLADAVGKIAAMEPVVEAALSYSQAPPGRKVESAYDLQDAIDAYEASLSGLVPV